MVMRWAVEHLANMMEKGDEWRVWWESDNLEDLGIDDT